MTPERRAEVWCWLAMFYSAEGDTILYANPPPGEEELGRASELLEASEACFKRACALDPSDALWPRAQVSWCDVPEVRQ